MKPKHNTAKEEGNDEDGNGTKDKKEEEDKDKGKDKEDKKFAGLKNPSGAPLRHMSKDMKIVQQLSRDFGLEGRLATTEAAASVIERAAAKYPEADIAASLLASLPETK
jgi:hypothetical protein